MFAPRSLLPLIDVGATSAPLPRPSRVALAASLFVALALPCVAACGGASTAPVDAPPKPPEPAASATPVTTSAPEATGEGSAKPEKSDAMSGGKDAESSQGFGSIGSTQGARPPKVEAAPAPTFSPDRGAPGGQGAGGGQGKGGVEQAVANTTTTPLAGRLTQKDIGEILSKNSALFNDCYTIGANGRQSFTGVVTVRATLGPSGAVNEAVVTKSTAQNAKVDACVAAAFKKIKFPKPVDGATSVITFPMEFNGVEQVQ